MADDRLRPFIRPKWRTLLQVPMQPPYPSCKGTQEAVSQLLRWHVPILAGTDSPVPGTAYGASLHGELALLVRAGATPTQALAAATSVAAHVFHLSDRGLIKPGLRADLVLVEGDPRRTFRPAGTLWRFGKKELKRTVISSTESRLVEYRPNT
jgi:imidazolonepropionase-like amidohydrolase